MGAAFVIALDCLTKATQTTQRYAAAGVGEYVPLPRNTIQR